MAFRWTISPDAHYLRFVKNLCNLSYPLRDMLNEGIHFDQREYPIVMYSERLATFELQDILARERRRIVGLCATLVHNAEVAEDLAQETLYEAWKHRDSLRDDSRSAEWLSGIARNVSLRWLRRQRRDMAHMLRYTGEPDTSISEADTVLEAVTDDIDIEAELSAMNSRNSGPCDGTASSENSHRPARTFHRRNLAC